jgi:hypothetical protein
MRTAIEADGDQRYARIFDTYAKRAALGKLINDIDLPELATKYWFDDEKLKAEPKPATKPNDAPKDKPLKERPISTARRQKSQENAKQPASPTRVDDEKRAPAETKQLVESFEKSLGDRTTTSSHQLSLVTNALLLEVGFTFLFICCCAADAFMQVPYQPTQNTAKSFERMQDLFAVLKAKTHMISDDSKLHHFLLALNQVALESLIRDRAKFAFLNLSWLPQQITCHQSKEGCIDLPALISPLTLLIPHCIDHKDHPRSS